MKLSVPAYYTQFHCIADRCTHSCCVGWEIDIDPDTLQKYADISHPYGTKIRESIDRDAETPCFRLGEGERCPHLDGQGLCRIIQALGEGYLCEICREHPRFYNRTREGLEVGLGMACEEACRLILTSDRFTEITEIGEVDSIAKEPDFDVLPVRAQLLAILADPTRSHAERLRFLYDVCGVSPTLLPDEGWKERLAALEYLEDAHRALFACYRSDTYTPQPLEAPLSRALGYLIYRHCTAARDAVELREALLFCFVCERLLASLATNEGVCDVTGLVPLAVALSEEIEYSEENTAAIKAALA